jgi:hypothetical protein
MNEYYVEWNETVSYRAIVDADTPEEAITVIKEGSQPIDTKSTWNEWDDYSFVATKKCRCGEEAKDNGMCWQCEEVEDQRQVDRA